MEAIQLPFPFRANPLRLFPGGTGLFLRGASLFLCGLRLPAGFSPVSLRFTTGQGCRIPSPGSFQGAELRLLGPIEGLAGFFLHLLQALDDFRQSLCHLDILTLQGAQLPTSPVDEDTGHQSQYDDESDHRP